MDGPSVNLKFYNEIVRDRQENLVHSLIGIGSCSLHIVHGSFKTGAEKTGWNLKALLKGLFQILHDTPARREDYKKVTGRNKYPLFFCATLNVFLLSCFFNLTNLDVGICSYW